MEVKCHTGCWDSKRCNRFFPGDRIIDLDPMDPLAKYFEGWPVDIPVYAKEKGVEGYRIGGKGSFFKGKP